MIKMNIQFKHLPFYWLFTAVFIIAFNQPAFCQSLPQDAPGQSSMLKHGVLIIVLNSNSSQVKYLNSVIADPSKTEKERLIASGHLKKIIIRRDSFNLLVRNSFDSVYQFSDVRYIYQQDFKSNDKNHFNQYFLDKSGKPDPELSIGDKNYLIMSYIDRTTSSGTTALNLHLYLPDMKEANRDIQFPGIGNLINILVDNGKYATAGKMLMKRILKFQHRLKSSYLESLKQE